MSAAALPATARPAGGAAPSPAPAPSTGSPCAATAC